MTSLRLFLSSTFSDLRDERLEVIEAIRRLRTISGADVDVVLMEDFGFSSIAPVEKSLDALRESDAYLGILGYRYGSTPRGGKLSFTEREYRLAHELRMPIFILERAGETGPDEFETDSAKLHLLQRLKEHAREHHVVLRYQTVDEIGRAIAQFLPSELQQHFGPDRLRPTSDSRLTVPIFRQEERLVPFTLARRSPHTLDVLALSAIAFMRERSVILDYLKNGSVVRIIAIEPGSSAERLVEEKRGTRHLASDLVQLVERALEVRAAAKHDPGTIDVRFTNWVPPCSLFLFDADTADPLGWIGLYTPVISSPAGKKWVIEVSSSSRDVAQFYKEQFDHLWREAKSAMPDGSL